MIHLTRVEGLEKNVWQAQKVLASVYMHWGCAEDDAGETVTL